MGVASPEGRWTRVNRALCELLGYREDELLGHRLLTLHNVHFTVALCRRARTEISVGRFARWSGDWISRYESAF